ncbi:MAG: DUF2512 family protein [Methylocystaceae bacterium]
MIGLTIKLVATPLIIYLVDLLSNQVNYASWWQIMMVSLFLAAVGQFLEAGQLMKGSVVINAGLNLIVNTLLLYLSNMVLSQTTVTIYGAVITALLIVVVEYFYHRYLVTSERKFPF